MSLSEGVDETAVAPQSPAVQRLVHGLGGAITLCALAWAADLPRRVGLNLYTEQFLAVEVGLALGMLYLQFRIRKGAAPGVPWYDWVAAVLGMAIGFYIAVDYPWIIDQLSYRPPALIAIGAVLLVLTIDGVRRIIGIPLTIVALVFIAYCLWGHLIPGKLAGRPLDLSRLMVYLSMDTNALLGTPLIVGTTVVVPFIFFGALLTLSGGSAFFTDIAMALMGRYRGGPAKIAVSASALFGMISGSAVSNVASVGVITIPLMRQAGYAARTAAAIEAVGSTGGQLMPPVMGAAAFLMAEFLKIPYTDVVVAAIIPSLLYYLALFFQADLTAARHGIARMEASRIPAVRKVLLAGWHFPVPFVVLIVAMFSFNASPQAAALYASGVLVVTGIAFGYDGKRMRPLQILTALKATGGAVVDLILICAVAGVVIGALNVSGLSFGLTLTLLEVGGESLIVLLILSALIGIILGMGMPTVGVYVLLATLAAPGLVQLGVQPIAAHMFVMYFGMMSMITPPVALAAFTAASIAKTEPMRTGFEACKFGWSAFIVPFLFVMSPTLLFQGQPIVVAIDLITAIAGVWVVSIALVGYLVERIGLLGRLAFGAAGLLLLLPANTMRHGVWLAVIGGLAAVALVAAHLIAARKRQAVARSPA
jgi:TRAP transporter 4TM/12TM fusion protein